MADGTTAHARFRRLLHVLPAASRAGGASLDELATELETTVERIVEDLEQVTERAYYHPGGWPDDVQIFLEPGRVRVTHAGGLTRPLRLDRLETVCLALALRGGAAPPHLPDQAARESLLRRAEAHLASGDWSEEEAPSVAAPDRAPDPEGIRETLMNAARHRRPCAIHYAKPGAGDGSLRVIHPYVMAYGEGSWYAVGHCLAEDGIRVFRVDRILAADHTDGAFQVPDDFDAGDFLAGGKVYHAAGDREVRVRYSPKIARWIRERAEWRQATLEEEEDGSVVVRHRVADPHWAVGHALQYGAEAEILEPEDVRAMVREVVEELAG